MQAADAPPPIHPVGSDNCKPPLTPWVCVTAVNGVMKKELKGYMNAFGKAQKSYTANLNAALVEIAAVLAKSERGSAMMEALVAGANS